MAWSSTRRRIFFSGLWSFQVDHQGQSMIKHVVSVLFKLIDASCKAAIKVKEVRESIFDALGSIPTTLANAKLYTEMWKSVELHREFSKLYTAILEVFEHMLSWLLEKHHIKALKVFGQQDSYEDKLKKMIRNVEECATSVREQASICSQWVIGSVNCKMDRRKLWPDDIPGSTLR